MKQIKINQTQKPNKMVNKKEPNMKTRLKLSKRDSSFTNKPYYRSHAAAVDKERENPSWL